MDKLHFETPNLTEQNIDRIAELFPGVITEKRDENGKLTRAVNFELLRQLLSSEVLAGDEAYEFTWVGKKASIVEANRPIRKTLRPCKEESKDWDTTENLYIEGDNLDVLKLLQESYLGKVKVVYIDPPYNTGHDFIYNDRFEMDEEKYNQQIGLFDEEENRNFRENNESNPRFHSDWCSMMYSRLMLARSFLTEDGIIFISIDDNEYANLRAICDEAFSSKCFLATFVWRRRSSSAMDKSKCSTDHEYVLAYAMSGFKALRGNNKDYKGYSNPDNDPRGPWTTGDLTVGMTGDARPNQYYNLVDPKTGKIYKPNFNRVWSYIPTSMAQLIAENRLVFPDDTSQRPMKKRFASELESDTNPQSTWLDTVGLNTEATRQINDLFGTAMFNYSKPESLLKALISQATSPNSITMDFFAGSCSTAHSMFRLNAEDGGHRKFIMVQLPEPCDEKSEAYKAGYKNICEIGKERIRRAGAKIKSEAGLMAQTLDTGFRVFKLDETNMKDVFYSAEEYTQTRLDDMISNIKDDRTDLDLLYGCLLEWGLPLSLPHVTETIEGCNVHTVNGGDLIACFDEDIHESVIKKIAERKPLRVVFRDSSFASSPEKINVTEIFKLMAPGTSVRVI